MQWKGTPVCFDPQSCEKRQVLCGHWSSTVFKNIRDISFLLNRGGTEHLDLEIHNLIFGGPLTIGGDPSVTPHLVSLQSSDPPPPSQSCNLLWSNSITIGLVLQQLWIGILIPDIFHLLEDPREAGTCSWTDLPDLF